MLINFLRHWFDLPSPEAVRELHRARHGRELAELDASVQKEVEQSEILHRKRLQVRMHNARLALHQAAERHAQARVAAIAAKHLENAEAEAHGVAAAECDRAEKAFEAYHAALPRPLQRCLWEDKHDFGA